METIMTLVEDVEAWRRSQGGRGGLLSVDLQRRAGILAGWLGEDPVAEALGLHPDILLRWWDRYSEAELRAS